MPRSFEKKSFLFLVFGAEERKNVNHRVISGGPISFVEKIYFFVVNVVCK